MTEAIDIFAVSIDLDWRLAGLLGTAFIAGIIRGFAGFGSALLLVPVLATLYDPRQAVVMEFIIEVPVVLGLMPVAIRHTNVRTVLPMVLMLILTLPFGTLVLKHLDAGIMKVAISIFVLLMLALIVFQGRVTALMGRGAVLGTGATIGLLQGSVGMAGPVAATTLMARGDRADVARANLITVAMALIVVAIVSSWLFGLLTKQVLVMGAIASPLCLAGVFVGTCLFNRYGDQSHRSVVFLLIMIPALATLMASLF